MCTSPMPERLVGILGSESRGTHDHTHILLSHDSGMPERLDGLYFYSVSKSLSATGRCLENKNIVSPKIKPLQMVPKT
jgi:hypothetical protein